MTSTYKRNNTVFQGLNKIRTQPHLKSLFSFQLLLFAMVMLSGFSFVQAQEIEIKLDIPVRNLFEDYKEPSKKDFSRTTTFFAQDFELVRTASSFTTKIRGEKQLSSLQLKTENESIIKDKVSKEIDAEEISNRKKPSQTNDKEKFHWKRALIESGVFLGIKHGVRMAQEKTRRELGGPFFSDWKQSVKGLRGWGDGDGFFTNYIAHPGQGGITGRIFINNSDRAKKQEFGKSKKYWESRMKALAWSAVWSTQFELGPISEASIGNVGLRQKNGYSTMSYVDLVMTPVAGTGIVIAEDAVDKYFLRNWLEKKTSNKLTVRILRSLLNPTTSIGNMLHLKAPWKRYNR